MRRLLTKTDIGAIIDAEQLTEDTDLARLIAEIDHSRYLSFSSYLESETGLALLRAIARFPRLTRLNLEYCQIGAKGAIALASASLPQAAKLRSLTLSFCKIGDRGLITLAPLWRNMPELDSLELAHNDISNQGALSLFNLSPLRSLNLSSNQLTSPLF